MLLGGVKDSQFARYCRPAMILMFNVRQPPVRLWWQDGIWPTPE